MMIKDMTLLSGTRERLRLEKNPWWRFSFLNHKVEALSQGRPFLLFPWRPRPTASESSCLRRTPLRFRVLNPTFSIPICLSSCSDSVTSWSTKYNECTVVRTVSGYTCQKSFHSILETVEGPTISLKYRCKKHLKLNSSPVWRRLD